MTTRFASADGTTTTAVRDVIGIGFGPGNLGLAIALGEDDPLARPLDAMFLEQRAGFAWHPGMLLPGTNMQISFLKDLVTMRNPQSRFSFVNYLKEHQRLPAFINRQSFTPERVEFADYLTWVAANVDADVRYGRRVVSIERLSDSAVEKAVDGARFRVHAERTEGDGEPETFLTRSVVVARGLQERLPDWAGRPELVSSGRVFHNHWFVDRMAALAEFADSSTPSSYLVVGGGQSAAEVLAHLHETGATVTAAFHGYGFAPADDSPFANEVFDPDAVDDFFVAPDHVRTDLMERHRYTNYSCVEAELLTDLYNRVYRERITGDHRIRLRRATEVTGATIGSDGRVAVELWDRIAQRRSVEVVDAVICATGFTSPGLLGVSEYDRGLSVSRDHQAEFDGGAVPGLFVQGATEGKHGIGATLLSNIAVRSGELHAAIATELDATELDATDLDAAPDVSVSEPMLAER